jgi:hypothetical protein
MALSYLMGGLYGRIRASCYSIAMNALGTLLLLLVTPASAQEPSLVFNEIAWMGTTTSANDEWIELYNPASTELDVTGYKIVASDGSPSITLKGMVLPYGFFLLERTDDTTTPALADMLYTGALSNETETLRLYDASGNLIDELSGWSAGDNETKQTMARDANGWKFGPPNGTPGSVNTFSEAPAQEVATPKKQTAPATASRRSPAPTPLVAEELPETPPISATALPIALKNGNSTIPAIAGLFAALVGAGAVTFFLLPRTKK